MFNFYITLKYFIKIKMYYFYNIFIYILFFWVIIRFVILGNKICTISQRNNKSSKMSTYMCEKFFFSNYLQSNLRAMARSLDTAISIIFLSSLNIFKLHRSSIYISSQMLYNLIKKIIKK